MLDWTSYLLKWKARMEGDIINNWVRGRLGPTFAIISLKPDRGGAGNSSLGDRCTSDLNYWATLSLYGGLKSLLLPFKVALIDVSVCTVFIVHQSILWPLLSLALFLSHVQCWIFISFTSLVVRLALLFKPVFEIRITKFVIHLSVID